MEFGGSSIRNNGNSSEAHKLLQSSSLKPTQTTSHLKTLDHRLPKSSEENTTLGECIHMTRGQDHQSWRNLRAHVLRQLLYVNKMRKRTKHCKPDTRTLEETSATPVITLQQLQPYRRPFLQLRPTHHQPQARTELERSSSELSEGHPVVIPRGIGESESLDSLGA